MVLMWKVKKVMIEVFGFGNWKNRVVFIKLKNFSGGIDFEMVSLNQGFCLIYVIRYLCGDVELVVG